MRNLYFFAFISLLLFSSCKKDNGSLTMIFKGTYDNNALVLFEGLPYSSNADINFSAANFFVSNVELVNNNGSSVALNEIDLIDIGATTQAAAEAGTSIAFKEIEPGEYAKLRFSIGVPNDLNIKTPDEFGAGHPLANTAYYWDAWQSYIFSKTEGNLDTVMNGVFDMGWLVHVGKSTMIRTFETPGKVSIKEGGNTEIDFSVDFKKLLTEQNGEPFNLKEKPRNHNPNDTLRIRQFVNNYSGAITILE